MVDVLVPANTTQPCSDAQAAVGGVGGPFDTTDQSCHDAQTGSVGGVVSSPTTHPPIDAQNVLGGGGSRENPTTHSVLDAHGVHGGGVPHDALLLFWADILDDLERTRIANENRRRSLLDPEHGKGWPEHDPNVAIITASIDGLAKLEHQAELQLKRIMRKHPLGPWVKATKGVGEKQAARLLAAVGDPYIDSRTGTPRTVSALWAYCGLHVVPATQVQVGTQRPNGGGGGRGGAIPARIVANTHKTSVGVAPSRQRGQKSNWSTIAKTRTYLVAESCIKQAASPYRAVYDHGRAKYADTTHQVECKRCGPSGSPAQPGSPLSAGHQHARAMRLVMKAILKDLWTESRRIHRGSVTQTRVDGGVGPQLPPPTTQRTGGAAQSGDGVGGGPLPPDPNVGAVPIRVPGRGEEHR